MSGFFDTFADDTNANDDDVFEDFSEEIRDIINEMGYNVEEQELHEIEKDLRLLEENADVADQQLFSCLLDRFDGFSTDPEGSIQHLSNLIASPAQPSKSTGIPQELDELITHGYERLQEVYEDIKKYEKLLGDNSDQTKKVVDRDGNRDSDAASVAELSQASGSATDRDGKENKRAPAKEKRRQINPREETRLLNQFLRENALRPTSCPQPGRLPFKHDHRLKLEHYRKEWAKLPPPDEQKRMALRWRIRELMLRRDIPHLRLIPDDSANDDAQCGEDQQQQPLRVATQWKP